MIFSDGFWRRRFGANPNILAKSVRLDNAEYMVVGILPANFVYPSQLQPDAFVPLALPTKPDWSQRESDDMSVVARLNKDVPLPQAVAELQTIAQSLTPQYPQAVAEKLAGAQAATSAPAPAARGGYSSGPVALDERGGAGSVDCLRQYSEPSVGTSCGATEGICGALCIGSSTHAHHPATADGGLASRRSGIGGGAAVAWGALDVVRLLRPDTLDYFGDVHLNGAALCFTLLVSLVTAILFSLAPALVASQAGASIALREAGGKTTPGPARQKLGSVLVAAELAFAFLLLMGAGLMLRTFANLRAVSPGFNPQNVLTVQVTLTEAKYPDLAQRKSFFDKLLAAVQATPGVESAGGTTVLPFYYGFSSPVKMTIKDHPSLLGDQSPSVPLSDVTPDYFSAMQVPLRAGRFFTTEDRPGSLPVAIVSQEFASRFFAGADPVGEHLTFAPATKLPEQEFTVIGVVGDVRYIGLDRQPVPVVFTSTDQFPASALTLAVRTRIAPESLIAAVRREVQNLDQEQPIYHVATMEQRVADSVGPQRFDASLLALFAAVALLLAVVGIYGVMSYWVTQRTHEIGVRVALGAQRRQVLQLVLARAAWLTLGGLTVGLVGAFVLARSLSGLLFGVRPIDPLTFLAASVALAGIALVASWQPARRAASVDPMVALRYE